MHKMPRVWVEYLQMLVDQKLVTKARRTFDRALQALPITQHDRVWSIYLVRPSPHSCMRFCSCLACCFTGT